MNSIKSIITKCVMLIAVFISTIEITEAEYNCPAQTNTLKNSVITTGTSASCFRYEVLPGSPFVKLQFDTSQSPMDLFFSPGIKNTLTDWDRVNAGPVEGETKFVLLEPQAGPYTVAVVPKSGPANFSLSANTGISGGDSEPITVCNGDICTVALPMMVAAQALQLGSKFGDRLIFPLLVTKPGKVDIKLNWTGSAQKLAIILNGPDRPELANPVAYYARVDGRSPLNLSYFIKNEDMKNGKRFKISVINFSGGEALGDIKITKPKAFNLNVTKLVLLPPVVLTINQQKLCRNNIQNKIAWDYRGSKQWNLTNLNRLCKNTAKAMEPGLCFDTVMHKNIDWGGGTQWQWKNALDLCSGTNNALQTVNCFKRKIRTGTIWQNAITTCKS